MARVITRLCHWASGGKLSRETDVWKCIALRRCLNRRVVRYKVESVRLRSCIDCVYWLGQVKSFGYVNETCSYAEVRLEFTRKNNLKTENKNV